MNRIDTRYRLGKWLIDPRLNRIEHGDQIARLEPLTMNVLAHLLIRAGEVVSTEELLDEFWQGRHAEPGMVVRCLKQIRQALGDDARNPAYIETIRKRGYRVVAPVNAVEAGPEVLSVGRATAPVAETAIAVLPFTDFGDDPAHQHFGAGLSEDILNGLARSTGIKVIARSSSFQFSGRGEDVRKIGRELGVTHVLEGSVRVAGNRVRATAQLVSTIDGAHFWSARYDRDLEDVFNAQDEITASILHALNLYFMPRSRVPTSNPAAFAAFVEARHFGDIRRPDLMKVAYDRALSLDPHYADAHVGQCQIPMVFIRRMSISELRDDMGDHLDRALAIDPGHQLARSYRALLRFFADRHFQEGIDESHRVLAEHPADSLPILYHAMLLRALGRQDDMIRVTRRAVAVDPLNPLVKHILAENLLSVGECAAAIEVAREAERMGLKTTHLIAAGLLLKGDMEALRALLAQPPGNWDEEARRLLFLAELARDDGDTEKLDSYIELLETHLHDKARHLPGPAGIRTLAASVALLKGDVDTAVSTFQTSATESFHPIWFAMGSEPDPNQPGLINLDRRRYPEFYSHPSFHRVVETLGFDRDAISKVRVPVLPF